MTGRLLDTSVISHTPYEPYPAGLIISTEPFANFIMADKYDDEILLREFSRGSPPAFQEIFMRYHDKIYFTSFRITRNMQEAQDIALVTFQKLFDRCADFKDLQHVKHFIYVTARNRSLTYIRDLKTLKERQQQFLKSVSAEGDSSREELDADFLHTVFKGMDALPERARLVLKLRYIDELSNQEIAAMLGISANTVKNHLARALAKLRESLQNRHVTELVVTAVVAFFFLK